MDIMYPNKEINSIIRLKLYKDRKSLVKDAFRALLELKPSLRIEAAIDLYRKKEITLWSAAEMAGMNMEGFKDILVGRGIGIEISSSKEESERRLKRVFS